MTRSGLPVPHAVWDLGVVGRFFHTGQNGYAKARVAGTVIYRSVEIERAMCLLMSAEIR